MSEKLHGASAITHSLKNIGFGDMKVGVGVTAIVPAIFGAVVGAGIFAILHQKSIKEKHDEKTLSV